MGETSVAGLALELVPALLLVVLSPLAIRKLMRRQRVGSPGGLRVVERAPVGRSAAAVVVQSAGRRFLLGVTEGTINLISELEPEPDTDRGTEAPPTTPRPWTGLLEQFRQMTLRRPMREPVRVLDR